MHVHITRKCAKKISRVFVYCVLSVQIKNARIERSKLNLAIVKCIHTILENAKNKIYAFFVYRTSCTCLVPYLLDIFKPLNSGSILLKSFRILRTISMIKLLPIKFS